MQYDFPEYRDHRRECVLRQRVLLMELVSLQSIELFGEMGES